MINKISIDDYSDEEVKAEYEKRILDRHIKWYEIFNSDGLDFTLLREFYGFYDPVKDQFNDEDLKIVELFESIFKKAKEKGLV